MNELNRCPKIMVAIITEMTGSDLDLGGKIVFILKIVALGSSGIVPRICVQISQLCVNGALRRRSVLVLEPGACWS